MGELPRAGRVRAPAVFVSFLWVLAWLHGGARPAGSEALVCHAPAAPAPRTLLLSPPDVPGHLKHGDEVGLCAPEPPRSNTFEGRLDAVLATESQQLGQEIERQWLGVLTGPGDVVEDPDRPVDRVLHDLAACVAQELGQQPVMGYAWALSRYRRDAAGELVADETRLGGDGYARAPWEGQGGTPMTPRQPMLHASTTKVYAAAATVAFLQQGGIDVDEPIFSVLRRDVSASEMAADPSLSGNPLVRAAHLGLAGGYCGSPSVGSNEDVTTKHLLTHSAGYRGAACTPEGILGLLACGPHTLPGQLVSYENVNFCLVEYLVEALARRRFEDVMRELVLEPAGIGEAFCASCESVGHWRRCREPSSRQPVTLKYNATDVARGEQIAGRIPTSENSEICAHGFIVASAEETLRFMRWLRDQDAAFKNAFDRECTQHKCLGFFIDASAHGDIGVHNGGSAGCESCGPPERRGRYQGLASWMVRLPYGIDAVVLTNTAQTNDLRCAGIAGGVLCDDGDHDDVVCPLLSHQHAQHGGEPSAAHAHALSSGTHTGPPDSSAVPLHEHDRCLRAPDPVIEAGQDIVIRCFDQVMGTPPPPPPNPD